MTILTEPGSILPLHPRLLTVADLAALPSELPSGPVRYELDDGRLIVVPPPGYLHGHTELRIGTQLMLQGELRGFGEAVSGEAGLILRRHPDRVVGVDALFVCSASLPVRLTPEGYLETIPDLAVEVRRKNDSKTEMKSKAEEYLAAGVKVVWVADRDAETITVFRAGQEPQVLTGDDILTVEDLIPGFQAPVRRLL
jgi:Uma2 family endonuclease